MTKAKQAMLDNYKRATATTLNEVYSTYSHAKHRAYMAIAALCVEMGGRRLRVFNANTYSFCMAFVYKKDDLFFLHYETSSKVYDFQLDACDLESGWY